MDYSFFSSIINTIYSAYQFIIQIKGFGDIVKGISYIASGVGKFGNWLLSVFNLSIPPFLMGLILIIASGMIFWNIAKSVAKFILYFALFLFVVSILISLF